MLGIVLGFIPKILTFLASPVGVAVLIGLAWLGGEWHGRRVVRAEWAVAVQASVDEAKRIDVLALDQQLARARQQAVDAQTRATLGALKLQEFADAVKDECILGDDSELLNRFGLSDDAGPAPGASAR